MWQMVVRLSTSKFLCFNKLNKGVTGVPEFLLSAFSSVTLIAQYRSTSFRSSKVLTIVELPSNTGPAWEAIKYQYDYVHRGRGSVFLGGVVIDLKFLICLLFLVATIWTVFVTWSFYWGYKFNEGKHSNSHWFLLPPTPVPYSTGVLWSTVSVCVQWPTNYYCIRDERSRSMKHYHHRYSCGPRLLGWNYNARARVVATTTTVSSKYLPKDELHLRKRLSRRNLDTYRYIQHQFKCLHRRSTDVEANVAFMNSVLMSDPLVYLNLIFGSSELAYYQSIWCPQQILLLPVAAVGEFNEFTSGLKLLRQVNTSDLTWSELVQCG